MEEGKLSIFYISKLRIAAVATELNDTFGCQVSMLWVARKSSCEWEALMHGRHATIALLKDTLYSYILFK